MSKVLVVEDDRDLCIVIADCIRAQNHLADILYNGREALDQLRFNSYDLIILDWGLPEVTGVEICKTFRSAGGTCPILMLTGRRDISEKETGLDSGADDYLTKPFNPRELAARVRALLRRSASAPTNVLKVGHLCLEADSHRVTRNGEEIYLQPQEFALLEFLMRNPAVVFNIDALMNRVWPSGSDASPDNVRICVSKLRSKIDLPGELSILKTVHGLGYKLES